MNEAIDTFGPKQHINTQLDEMQAAFDIIQEEAGMYVLENQDIASMTIQTRCFRRDYDRLTSLLKTTRATNEESPSEAMRQLKALDQLIVSLRESFQERKQEYQTSRVTLEVCLEYLNDARVELSLTSTEIIERVFSRDDVTLMRSRIDDQLEKVQILIEEIDTVDFQKSTAFRMKINAFSLDFVSFMRKVVLEERLSDREKLVNFASRIPLIGKSVSKCMRFVSRSCSDLECEILNFNVTQELLQELGVKNTRAQKRINKVLAAYA